MAKDVDDRWLKATNNGAVVYVRKSAVIAFQQTTNNAGSHGRTSLLLESGWVQQVDATADDLFETIFKSKLDALTDDGEPGLI